MTESPKGYREEELRQALASDPRVAEPELDVTIAGDRVVISGTVPTEDRRTAVTDVTREHCPDRRPKPALAYFAKRRVLAAQLIRRAGRVIP